MRFIVTDDRLELLLEKLKDLPPPILKYFPLVFIGKEYDYVNKYIEIGYIFHRIIYEKENQPIQPNPPEFGS